MNTFTKFLLLFTPRTLHS